MPVIPIENEGQRLDQRSPVEGVNTSDAGIGARMVSSVGTGLSKLGEGLVDLGKVREAERAARSKIKVGVFEQEMERLAQERADNALRTAQPDGSNMVDLFNAGDEKNSGYEDIYKSRLDGEPDEGVRYEMAAKAMDIQNKYTSDLRAKSRAQLVEYGVTQSKNVYNQALAAGLTDPDNVELATNQFYRSSKMTEKLLPPGERNKIFNQFQIELGAARIEGYTNKRKYDDAERVLQENAGRFGPDEFKKISDRINNKRMEDLNFDMKMSDRRDKQAAEELKRTQDANFRDLFNQQASGADISEQSAILYGQNKIRSEHFSLFEKREDKIDDIASSGTAFNIYERGIRPNAQIRDLISEVTGLRRQGRINNEDAMSTVGKLMALEDKKKDKKFSDPGFNKLFSANMKAIEIRYGGRSVPGFLTQYENPANEEKANTVKTEYIQRVYFQGQEQMNALRTVLKKNSGFVETEAAVPAIPGLSLSSMKDPQAIKAAKNSLRSNYKKGSMPQKEYLESLQRLDKLESIQKEIKTQQSWGAGVIDGD